MILFPPHSVDYTQQIYNCLLMRICLTSYGLEWEEPLGNSELPICEIVLDGNAVGASGVKLLETSSHNCRLVKKTTLLKS